MTAKVCIHRMAIKAVNSSLFELYFSSLGKIFLKYLENYNL